MIKPKKLAKEWGQKNNGFIRRRGELEIQLRPGVPGDKPLATVATLNARRLGHRVDRLQECPTQKRADPLRCCEHILAAILFILLIGCGIQGNNSSRTDAENPFLAAGEQEKGWPTLRGADLDGRSNEIHLADRWPQQGPPVLWRRSLGQGYSSFVAYQDRVFTQYQTLAGQFVLCLDAASGSTLWTYRYGDAYESTGMYPGPRSTPTINGRHVYFTTPQAVVSCLDWNGKLVWSVDLKARFGSRGTGFGYACSPIIQGEQLFLPIGGKDAAMVALDTKSGDIHWASGNDAASYVPALPTAIKGDPQVIGFMQHALVGYDQNDGTELWRVDLSRGYDEHAAWPIIDGDLVWVSAPFQSGCQLYRIQTDLEPSVSQIHESETLSNDVASSVLVDGCVYGFNLAEAQSKPRRPSRGSFQCIDFLTGEVQWSNGNPKERRTEVPVENKQKQTIGHASVIVADKKLILLSDTGDLILAEADPTSYRELARARLLPGQTNWSTPALHRGRLFLRNHAEAICVDLGDPKVNNGESRRPSWRQTLRLQDAAGIKTEFTLATPSGRFLVNSFAATAAAIAVAALIVAAFTFARRRNKAFFRLRLAIASYLLCIVAGPILSHSLERFVFTWPGCLLITFIASIFHATLRRKSKAPPGNAGRLVAAIFLVTCLTYFVLCQRLGLVPQWCFLCGFPAALPFGFLARHPVVAQRRKHHAYELASLIMAGAAYWISTAVTIWWVYGMRW